VDDEGTKVCSFCFSKKSMNVERTRWAGQSPKREVVEVMAVETKRDGTQQVSRVLPTWSFTRERPSLHSIHCRHRNRSRWSQVKVETTALTAPAVISRTMASAFD
jgi:hypothetical protein